MFADTGCHRPEGPYQAIFSLAVLPEFQHRGFGGQLLRAMEALARREGRRAVTLTCRAFKWGTMRPLDTRTAASPGRPRGRALAQHGVGTLRFEKTSKKVARGRATSSGTQDMCTGFFLR